MNIKDYKLWEIEESEYIKSLRKNMYEMTSKDHQINITLFSDDLKLICEPIYQDSLYGMINKFEKISALQRFEMFCKVNRWEFIAKESGFHRIYIRASKVFKFD